MRGQRIGVDVAVLVAVATAGVVVCLTSEPGPPPGTATEVAAGERRPADAAIRTVDGRRVPPCVVVTAADAAPTVDVPCAVGVEVVARTYREVDGEACAALTLVPWPGAERRTANLCARRPRPAGRTTGRVPLHP